MLEYAVPFLEKNGWFILIGGIISYYVYKKFFEETIVSLKTAEEQKKTAEFDRIVHERNEARIAETRRRQQEHHDRISEEMKVQEEIKREQKMKELQKKLDEEEKGESVLSNAVRKAPVKKDKNLTGAEFIDKYVSSKPLVVFSKSACPFCRKVKSLLATYRLESKYFEYIELDERYDVNCEDVQQEFIKRYGSRTVPKVFISGELIGGCDDTMKLSTDGILEPLLTQAIELFSAK